MALRYPPMVPSARRSRRRAATFTILSALATACASAPGPDPAQVQQDVRACMQALYSGNADAVVDFTHPVILAKLGGRERSRIAIAEACQQLQKDGLRLESLEFPRAPEFLEAEGRWFAVVPTLSVIASPTQRFESLNFQFGILEPGMSVWKYIEGSRVEATDVTLLFPGFPASYRFPGFYRRKL